MTWTMKRALAFASLGLALPAFAGDLTGYHITKTAVGCGVAITGLYIDHQNRLQVKLENKGDRARGKLTIDAVVGTNHVSQVFNFAMPRGTIGWNIIPKELGSPVAGKDVTMSFTECTVEPSTP